MDIGRTTVEKIEMQNAADASAYSASLQLARGMNAITATNHHIGEMMSLVVLHKAIAGENVDGRDLSPSDLRADARYDWFLPRLAAGARRAGGWTSTYPEIARPLRAAETVGQAKLRLKGIVALIYAQQIVYSLSPWTRWLVPVLSAFEAYLVLPEWLALDRMEAIARADLPVRNLISRVLLPAARRYEDDVVRALPDLAGETATAVADRNHCRGALYPARPSLPVDQESFDAGDPDHARSMANTQIVRATFPWVNYHRSAVLSHTSWMILSGTSALYREWTDNDTTERSRQFYLRPEFDDLRDAGCGTTPERLRALDERPSGGRSTVLRDRLRIQAHLPPVRRPGGEGTESLGARRVCPGDRLQRQPPESLGVARPGPAGNRLGYPQLEIPGSRRATPTSFRRAAKAARALPSSS